MIGGVQAVADGRVPMRPLMPTTARQMLPMGRSTFGPFVVPFARGAIAANLVDAVADADLVAWFEIVFDTGESIGPIDVLGPLPFFRRDAKGAAVETHTGIAGTYGSPPARFAHLLLTLNVPVIARVSFGVTELLEG